MKIKLLSLFLWVWSLSLNAQENSIYSKLKITPISNIKWDEGNNIDIHFFDSILNNYQILVLAESVGRY